MNYKPFFAAYNASVRRGNPQSYKEAVAEFTGGRTDSLTALSHAEVQELTRRLNTLTGFKPNPSFGGARGGSGEKQRRQIIALAHEMNWKLPPPGGGVADMRRINEWVRTHGYLHHTGKHNTLNDYNENELPKLVWQFKQAHLHFLKNMA